MENSKKSKTNKNLIAQAIRHEQRLRLHTDTTINDRNRGLQYFLEWVKQLLPEDKYQIFCSILKLPIPTTGLVNSIFNELQKVFESKDPRIIYKFEYEEHESDFNNYIQNLLSPLWDEAQKILKKRINSVIVIDLPEEQKTEYPEPYWLEVPINAVYDFEMDNVGNFVWFEYYGESVIYHIDTEYYRTYDFTNNTLGSVIKESRHGLNFVPARFFWTDSLQESYALKESPLDGQLSELDWLLYWLISKKHLDNYAAYPIYSAYEQECDYVEEKSGKYCESGFLKNPDGYYSLTNYGVEKCPVCSGKRFGGVGSFVEIPVPDEETPDMSNPVQLTTVDKNSLDYNTNELYRIKNEVFKSVTGDNRELLKEQAINEKQVSASFESKLQVINNLKKNFEGIHQFIADTVATLRYGNSYKYSGINWGTEFYLYSSDELYTIYANAKKSGVSKIVLDKLLKQMYETMYRNNPDYLNRALIAFDLEPFVHLSDDEVLNLYKQNIATRDELRLKTNFSSCLSQFEYKNKSLVLFGSKLNYDTKISKIYKILISYGTENTE